MRGVLIVAGALLLLGGMASGCATLFVAFASFSPPHPDNLSFQIAAGAGPHRERTTTLGEGDHHAWVMFTTDAGPTTCTLAVYRSDGTLVGRSQGSDCSLTAGARSGEQWEVEATASAPASAHVGFYNPLLPWPLWLVLLAAIVGAITGVVLLAIGVTRRGPISPS